MQGRVMTSPVSGEDSQIGRSPVVCSNWGRVVGERREFGCGASQSVSSLGSQLGTYPSLGSVLWLGCQDRAKSLQQGWVWRTACQEVTQEPHIS